MRTTGRAIAALAIALMLIAGCQRQAPPATEQPGAGQAGVPDLGGRTIRIATDPTYPPFEFQDQNKNIVGYDVDLLNEICALANCKAEFRGAAWEGIFAALAQGDYDAVASGVTITEERDRTVDFTTSYMRVGQVVLVRADETRINGVDDLSDKSVAVQTGTSNDELATKLQQDGKVREVKRFRTFDLAVQSLLNRDADAVIIDNTSASGFMAQNQGRMKTVGGELTSEELGIAVREGDTQLKQAFDAALAQLRQNGTLDRLYKKWFEDYKPGQ